MSRSSCGSRPAEVPPIVCHVMFAVEISLRLFFRLTLIHERCRILVLLLIHPLGSLEVSFGSTLEVVYFPRLRSHVFWCICIFLCLLKVRLLLEWGAEVMVIDNKGKLPLHLVGQSASQKNRGKSEDIKKLLKSKMPDDDDQGEGLLAQRTIFQRALTRFNQCRHGPMQSLHDFWVVA